MNRTSSLLVVADDCAVRQALLEPLRQSGYTVEAAAGGDAVRTLTASPCDLLLLDIRLSDICSLELLKQIRAVHASAALPVLMVTTGSAADGLVEAMRAGANDYITAPLDCQLSLARIETHLSHKRATDALRTARLADVVTGLPNRMRFLDVVERALKRVERWPDYGFGILVLALDRLRIVHDSLGAAAADRLLGEVSSRLQTVLRATDVVTRDDASVTLARHAGDEFTVLVDDIHDASDAIACAERLRRALEAPFDIDGHRLFAQARIGIAVSSSGYTRAEDILRDATIALNRVTPSSALPYEIFDPEMRHRAMTRLTTETDLRQAIDKQHFVVHYQPIVSLKNGRIAGFEALARWRHPERGLVQPPDFIGIAEDTGMIVDIDKLTLAESCRQMAEWVNAFGAAAPELMCANLSGRQFANAELMTQIAATLQSAGLTPAHLKLEITENAFIADVPAAQRLLDRARAMGVEWSLDDFGTGYSSLSFLHRLRVETVKIDRSFVSAMGQDHTGLAMVRAIVGLAHALGMDVVAEGVETEAQATVLRALGCEYAQGFFFSRAVDTAAASQLIEVQPWQHAREAHMMQ